MESPTRNFIGQSQTFQPVVQKILGHSTPNLTASFVSFSDAEIQQVAKFFLEKESHRKTSARNTFFDKSYYSKGECSGRVELVTIAGDLLTTIITNDSLTRLGLNEGTLITVEVKAPWVILQKDGNEPICTAENFGGPLTASLRVRSPLSTWFVLPMGRNSALWLTSESSRRLDLHANDPVWAVFNSFSVVLHID